MVKVGVRSWRRKRQSGDQTETADSSRLMDAADWYAQYYQDGRQVRVSTKTEVKQEAIATLRKLMGDRDNGLTPISAVRRLRYADLRQALIDSYFGRLFFPA